MVDPGSRRSAAGALTVESVDLVPTDLGTVLVRVAGEWSEQAGADRPAPTLVVTRDGEERRFEALSETSQAAARSAPGERALRATFSVPEELGPALAGELALEVAGTRVRLPSPREVEGAASPGTVVDRAVLAERRARRAEHAEQANARRAVEAERALASLEAELAKLELRLERAGAERGEIEAELAERDRRLRAASQRAHAEQRLREEAVEEATSRVRRTAAEADDLRGRLTMVEARADALAVEVEDHRRRLAEAQNAAAAAAVTRRRTGHEPPPSAPPGAISAGPPVDLDALRSETAAARRLPPVSAGSAVASARPHERAAAAPLLEREDRVTHSADPGPAELARLRGANRRGAAAVAQAERAVGEARTELALIGERLARAEAERDDVRERLETELARLNAEAAEHADARAALVAEVEAERAERAALEADLEAERAAREAARTELDAEQAAAAQRLGELQRELDQRADLQQRAQHVILELRRHLEGLAEESAERDAAVAQLEARTDALRVERDEEREARANVEARLRRELERRAGLEAELDERTELHRRAERVMEQLRREVETLTAEGATLRADVAEREQRLGADEAVLAEFIATARGALEEAEQRITEAQEAGAEMQRRLDHERGERAAVERELGARLVRERAAWLAAERSLRRSLEAQLARRASGSATPDAERRRLSPRQPVTSPAAAGARATSTGAAWLVQALRRLSVVDESLAGRLLTELLPGQAVDAPRALEYDVDIARVGLFAVSLSEGRGRVTALERPRPAREVLCRVEADAATLTELLAGDSPQSLLRAGLRVSATRRRRRALRRIPRASLELRELSEIGVWPAPDLVYRALAGLIDPRWTRGHEFSVAHEVTGPGGESWHVHVADGQPVRVSAQAAPGGPQASVRMSQETFQRLLGGESVALSEKTWVRGDVRAVALLTRWTEWARGMGAPPRAARN